MEEQKNKIRLGDVPAGECFKVGEQEFVVLEHCIDATAVILKGLLTERQKFGKNNNFAGSFVDEICQEFAGALEAVVGKENLVEHDVDLTSDDGLKDYGCVSRKASLLTADQYRKYVEILDGHTVARWWWLATPWSTPRHDDDEWVKCVVPSGFIGSGNYYYVRGVRPFCIFKSDIFVSI